MQEWKEMKDYINQRMEEMPDTTLSELCWFIRIELGDWEEVIRMYLIGEKGVKIAINREISMSTIIIQLPNLENLELEMTMEYIRGLKQARHLR